jgi:hypothetical protein
MKLDQILHIFRSCKLRRHLLWGIFDRFHLCSAALDELRDLDPTVRIQNGRQPLFPVVLLPASSKYTCDLRKHAN